MCCIWMHGPWYDVELYRLFKPLMKREVLSIANGHRKLQSLIYCNSNKFFTNAALTR